MKNEVYNSMLSRYDLTTERKRLHETFLRIQQSLSLLTTFRHSSLPRNLWRKLNNDYIINYITI